MTRQSKAEKYELLYDATEAEMHSLLAKIPVALRELIEGIWREELTRTGDRRVYRERPSIEAIKLVFERTYGKVPTKVEVDAQVTTTNVDLTEYKTDEITELLELALSARTGQLGGATDGAEESNE